MRVVGLGGFGGGEGEVLGAEVVEVQGAGVGCEDEVLGREDVEERWCVYGSCGTESFAVSQTHGTWKGTENGRGERLQG